MTDLQAALTEALRDWRKVYVDPSDPDRWYEDSARAILAHPAMVEVAREAAAWQTHVCTELNLTLLEEQDADLARKAAAADEWQRHAIHLYWFFRMTMQGGPDGSDLDEAVEEDARAAAAHVEKALGLDVIDQNIDAIAAALAAASPEEQDEYLDGLDLSIEHALDEAEPVGGMNDDEYAGFRMGITAAKAIVAARLRLAAASPEEQGE